MNAITLYTKSIGPATSFEFNVFDNQFATENLAVRKVFMAMLESVRHCLSDVEIEYNDSMLAEKMGGAGQASCSAFWGPPRRTRGTTSATAW